MPFNLEEGPVFIKDLAEQGMIDEQIATININPYKGNQRWNSRLTLGGVPPGLINGIWYDHSFTAVDYPAFTE